MKADSNDDDYSTPYTGAVPALPDVGRVDLGRLRPVYGLPAADSEPDYLKFDVKGRGYFERLFFNTGASYLIGVLTFVVP